MAQSVTQSVTNLLKGGSQAQGATAAPVDELGRGTPSGTVLGFLQAAQAGNYQIAADYLQMSAARRQSQGPELAEKLKVLMDRAFVGSLRQLSTSPEGNPEATPDQQTIGIFSSGDADVPVVLVRVADPNFGKIWLFSFETLSKVPELYDNLAAHQVEEPAPAKPGQKRVSRDAALAMAGTFRRDSRGACDRLGGGLAAGDSAAALAQDRTSPQPARLQPHGEAAAGVIQRAGPPRACQLPRPAAADSSLLLADHRRGYQHRFFLVSAERFQSYDAAHARSCHQRGPHRHRNPHGPGRAAGRQRWW